MWQAESFDPLTIDCELALAASVGFNTVRTYLHDLVWAIDPNGFKQRIDQFLDIATRRRIRPILVIFDDCWNAGPQPGLQPTPQPGVHNSGWMQSPGLDLVNCGPSAWGRLEEYVTDLLSSFADDERVLLWDLYNEPGNSGNGDKSLPLLKAVFKWARAVNPQQPLTAGVWFDNQQLNDFQLAASDVITFHNYHPADHLEREIAQLKSYGRPVICTEWMARTLGSHVCTNLPIFAREKVGCLNWGLVAGKTNTIYPWQSTIGGSVTANTLAFSETGAVPEPQVWFHDLFRKQGIPYDQSEIEFFKKMIWS
jgi:hypothetical protein